MHSIRLFLFLFVFIGCLQSCVISKKTIYLQDLSNQDSLTLTAVAEEEYLFQPKDVLYIRVNDINDETPDISTGVASSNVTPMNLYYSGYVIDDSGNVDIPQLGTVHLQGLSLMQVKDTIKKQVHMQLPYATVFVKPIFKISVLGEVKAPGVQYISNGQLTIYEALGYAGDLTDYGNRKTVKLVRTIGNQKILVHMDLTDPNLLKSPYLYIKPNDVIYVEPFRAKFIRINSINVSLFLSSVTLLIVIVNLVTK